jgi:peptidoglycan/xylan/chitin deacetylase (PgdA/CDA1 family)
VAQGLHTIDKMSRFGQLARGFGRFIPGDTVRRPGRPAAVFFHGVEDKTIDPRVQTHHHETAAFIAIARELKAQFDVLPLEAIQDVLERPERYPRAVFLMSDDGYANTQGVAANILEDLRLPWTLFISTHHIDSGERNPVFLAKLFAYYAADGRYEVPHFSEPLTLAANREIIAEHIVRRLCGLGMERAQYAVDAMTAQFDRATLAALLAIFSSETFLTWDGVRALQRRGVTIGAHAHRHWAMNDRQAVMTLRLEAETSKRRIEEEIGRCRYFSYPFGNKEDISTGAWRAVRDAGYDCAFAAFSGSLDAQANRFLLPRFAIGSDASHLTTLLRTGDSGPRWQSASA